MVSLASKLARPDGVGGPRVAMASIVFPHQADTFLGIIVDWDEPLFIDKFAGATEPKTITLANGRSFQERQYVVTVLALGGNVPAHEEVGKAARQARINELREAKQYAEAKQFEDSTPIPLRAVVPGELVRRFISKRHMYMALRDAVRGINWDPQVGMIFQETRDADQYVDRDGKPFQQPMQPHSFVLRAAQGPELAWVEHAIAKHHELNAVSLAGNVTPDPEPFPVTPAPQIAAPAPAPVAAAPVYAPAPVAAAPTYAPAPVAAAPVPVGAPAPVAGGEFWS